MKLTLSKNQLVNYTCAQLKNIFPDGNDISCIKLCINDTIERLYFCFKHINKPYYRQDGLPYFNHLNSDHYATYLYLLSNTVWKTIKDESVASKLFYLNKMLNGLDAFYKIELPEIFLFVHPVGTILGNAKYSNYFAVYQQCTIGATEYGIYPIFSDETILYSGTSVIGNCICGRNVVFGANSFIVNKTIEKNSIILGSYPNNIIINNNKCVIDRIFR